MTSVEFVTIKMELEMCHGCLSCDRSLIALSENTDLFLCLLGRDGVEDPTSISLCWECSAILRNTRRFQQRIQKAQDITQHSLNLKEHFCLSTLAINKTGTHCTTDLQSDLINQDHEIDTRCEGIFHQDILNKQPGVKVETIEVKYENEHDSEIHVDDVDMESVLREKEVYFNRTHSPSSTRHGFITVYPLVKQSKSNYDNEIKTEETTEVTDTEQVQERPNELFSCNVCGKEYTTEDYLNVHYRTHRAVGVFECDICKNAFLRKNDIKKHLRKHTGEKPYVRVSHKRSTKKLQPGNNLSTNNEEKLYNCEICDKRFTLLHHLKQHHRTHTADKPYSCEICDRRFISKLGLEVHLRTHSGDKPYSCEICGKSFIQKAHLSYHLRTHTGDKPYNCEICGQSFTQKAHLNNHLVTHTGEKPYNCELCDKRFSRKNHLKIHTRTHTGEKPYSCEVCDKRFNRQHHLKLHLRTHTGEKPYNCEICDKRFSIKKDLKIHIRTHTGEKPYSCEVCDKRFYRQQLLKLHIRTHTGEKPYNCETCDKRFNQKGNLKKHIKTHIGEPKSIK